MSTSKPLPQVRPGEPGNDRLDSWKEIAAYLKRDERTVRRWEAEGLPVRRKIHKRQASVFAYRAEIDAWWHAGHPKLEQGEPRASRKPLPWKALAAIAAAGLAAILALNASSLRARFRGRISASTATRSIAVLPLENLSNDPEQDYFADGMTEELTTQLAQISTVKVASRTSVMRFKGAKTPLSQIARELHVDAIVEGSIARSGQRVRINAQLIDASTDRHLWAHSYERDLREVLALQAEVAGAIAVEVNGRLTPEQRTHIAGVRPTNPDAYIAYLKGRYFLDNQRSAGGAAKSLEYSLQAVHLDPDWSLAHSGLANSYISAALLNVIPASQALSQAKTEAQRALQLDPAIAEAHVALGHVRMMFDYDQLAANREFKRATELSPGTSEPHRAYANYLANVGQCDQAVSEVRLAHQLDPMSFWITRDVGRILYECRRYDEALPALREASEMNPASPVVYNWLSWTYDKKGMIPESIEMDLKDQVVSGGDPALISELRKTFQTSGRMAYLRRKLERDTPDPYLMAQLNARLGNRDSAFRLLEILYRQHSGWICKLVADPELDNLRSDPRFQELLRRVGLSR